MKRRVSGVMRDQDNQVQRLMSWWEAGHGASAAAAHPVLSAIDVGHLAEIVSAGANYHTILTPERIFNMQQQLGNGSEPALEPLRKALLSRGGAKGQARAVGTLLFREAMIVFERCQGGGAAGPPSVAPSSLPVAKAVALDEIWAAPRRFVNSEAYPAGAQIAARSAPRKESDMIATFSAGATFLATGRCGEYLQFLLEDGKTSAYVPSRIGGLELLVPATPEAPPPGSPAPPSSSPMISSAQVVAAVAAAPCEDASGTAVAERVAALEARMAAAL